MTAQLVLFDLEPEQPLVDRSPCATEPGHCTSCDLAVCLDLWPTCSRCARRANLEVSSFSWHVNNEPGGRRKAYVLDRWVLSCWWHTGDVTDELRAAVLEAGPAYLIRWTAKPYGILAGGTMAYADVERVAA